MPQDEITEAVLSREEVIRYLEGGSSQTQDRARAAIHGYLQELRTTQRYKMYRALQHPLYPILRKIKRVQEGIDVVRSATKNGHVIYASNHKSHTDYLVEPLILDDNGIRPPVIAAGINLFGGALGLIHKHVTGAIPIRRETKDPAYLVTLKAYVAELLRRTDLFLYLEGGRSYSGELKPFKTLLLRAAVQTNQSDLVIIPTAIAYDLVLEDFILSRQKVKRTQRPFGREVAEMIRYAVGYQSRAIVSFGQPITMGDYDPDARRDMVRLQRRVREAVGRLYKVLPTALVAASLRRSMERTELEDRVDQLIETLESSKANLDVTSGRAAVDAAIGLLETRGIVVTDGSRYRVRERAVIRYYAHTIDHLLKPRRESSHTH
ncbi:MAG TPA: hypothetical protein EYO94_05345 [Acidobacteria bacterium]|nr:hypothetical protein [Acidobacteriota bacterium]